MSVVSKVFKTGSAKCGGSVLVRHHTFFQKPKSSSYVDAYIFHR